MLLHSKKILAFLSRTTHSKPEEVLPVVNERLKNAVNPIQHRLTPLESACTSLERWIPPYFAF